MHEIIRLLGLTRYSIHTDDIYIYPGIQNCTVSEYNPDQLQFQCIMPGNVRIVTTIYKRSLLLMPANQIAEVIMNYLCAAYFRRIKEMYIVGDQAQSLASAIYSPYIPATTTESIPPPTVRRHPPISSRPDPSPQLVSTPPPHDEDRGYRLWGSASYSAPEINTNFYGTWDGIRWNRDTRRKKKKSALDNPENNSGDGEYTIL